MRLTITDWPRWTRSKTASLTKFNLSYTTDFHSFLKQEHIFGPQCSAPFVVIAEDKLDETLFDNVAARFALVETTCPWVQFKHRVAFLRVAMKYTLAPPEQPLWSIE